MSSGMLQNKDTDGVILPTKLEVQLTLDNSNSEGRQENDQSKKQKQFILTKSPWKYPWKTVLNKTKRQGQP